MSEAEKRCEDNCENPEADPEVAGPSPPDYRWVVTEQKIIVRAEQVGEQEAVMSLVPEGLTSAGNGDLLLAACLWPPKTHPADRTVILRSADAGHTWTEQGILEHKKSTVGKGNTEGMLRLRSGRLVIIGFALDLDLSGAPRDEYFIPGGSVARFERLRSEQWAAYSDDEGKTWNHVPMDISPFLSASFHASSQIFETEDGTLVASFWGHLSQDELDSGITSCGIVRSHDSGLSWEDASIIHRAQPGSALWFCETQILPLEDGRWLCTVRLNDFNFKNFDRAQCRCYSHDQGRSWSYPVRTHFFGGEAGLGRLPDGAVMLAQTEPLNWRTTEIGLRYEVSYDRGLTWQYTAPLYTQQAGSGEHRGSVIIRALDDDTALAVYHRGDRDLLEKYGRDMHQGYGPLFIGASWLRKVPADSPLAAELTFIGRDYLFCNELRQPADH